MVGKDAYLPGGRSELGGERRRVPKALPVPEVNSHRPLAGARCNNADIRCPSGAKGEGISAGRGGAGWGGAVLEQWWRDCPESIPALLLRGKSEGLGGSRMQNRTPGLGEWTGELHEPSPPCPESRLHNLLHSYPALP